MSKTIIPANYTPALNLYDTQRAIGTVKRLFADTLCATLNLYRVSAPLFLEASTGLNDDLNGVERKVTFDIKDSGTEAQVVQSLAKWKRKALKDYGFRVGKGLYCDMNAIRRPSFSEKKIFPFFFCEKCILAKLHHLFKLPVLSVKKRNCSFFQVSRAARTVHVRVYIWNLPVCGIKSGLHPALLPHGTTCIFQDL